MGEGVRIRIIFKVNKFMKSTRANHTVIYVPIWIESVRRESAKQATPTIRAVYRWFFMPRQLFPAPFFIIGLCFLDFVTFHFITFHFTPYRSGLSTINRTVRSGIPVSSLTTAMASSLRPPEQRSACGYFSLTISCFTVLSRITPHETRYFTKCWNPPSTCSRSQCLR